MKKIECLMNDDDIEIYDQRSDQTDTMMFFYIKKAHYIIDENEDYNYNQYMMLQEQALNITRFEEFLKFYYKNEGMIIPYRRHDHHVLVYFDDHQQKNNRITFWTLQKPKISDVLNNLCGCTTEQTEKITKMLKIKTIGE